jgi:hypothetical protein
MRNNEGNYSSYAVRNNRHFEEKFEDSEVGSNVFEGGEAGGPGRAVQLIRMRPYGQIEVDQTALEIITNCERPVGFCCLAGKYRTGKSFLLNRLLKLEDNGVWVGLCSSEWIPAQKPAQRESGCGQSHCSTKLKATPSISWTLKDQLV